MNDTSAKGPGPVISAPDDAQLGLLSLLSEPGAVLALALSMEKAAILVRTGTGAPQHRATLRRDEAEAFVSRGWIACSSDGQISRYKLTAAGRRALNAARASRENAAVRAKSGEDEPDEPRNWSVRGSGDTPLMALARRKDKNGHPFLSRDLIRAGDRLREDFEISQLGTAVGQNWQHFLTPRCRSYPSGTRGKAFGARDRVRAALEELGPGLGDVAVICCCHLQGLETAEKKMGWSARSAKIVLRIALERLKRHYDSLGDAGALIG